MDNVDVTAAIRFPGIVYGALIVVATWFATRAATGALARLGDRFADKRLVLHQVATVTRFVLWLVGLATALALSLELSKEVVIALTGTIAVTIGFALKDLAASIVAGITIILDRPFQVGDRITFNGTYGEVAAIGLRSVRVVTLDDNVVTIPNNKFLTDAVASGNWGALEMLVQLDFFIGITEDVAAAREVVEGALISTRFVSLLKPPQVVITTVTQSNVFAVRVRAKAYVLDIKHEEAFQTDVTERVLAGFRHHGIRAPTLMPPAPTLTQPTETVQVS
jgi:small-conductance mechanosensitive channel